jgi:hypothetical protein
VASGDFPPKIRVRSLSLSSSLQGGGCPFGNFMVRKFSNACFNESIN